MYQNHPGIQNDTTPPGERFVYKDSDGVSRYMEVYFPPNHNPETQRVPAVLMFHGGGWTGGGPIQFRFFCAYLASRGIVAATASYQLNAGKAACVTDGKRAIHWMKSHADELGVDSERLIVGGGSAGGHVAVLATTTPSLNDPDDLPNIDTSVAGYILFNPAFKDVNEGDSSVYAADHAERWSAPAIVFYGEKDINWQKGWLLVLESLQRSSKPHVEYWVALGKTHGFFNNPPWREVTIRAVDRFLVNEGILEGEASLPNPDGEFRLVAGPLSE